MSCRTAAFAAAFLLAGPVIAAPHDPGLSSLRVRATGSGLQVHVAFANADFRTATSGAIDHDADGVISAAELDAATSLLRGLARDQLALVRGDSYSFAELRTARIAENEDVELEVWFALPDGEGDIHLDARLLQRMARGHRCYAAVLGAGDSILEDALLRPGAVRMLLPDVAVAPSGFAQSWAFFVLGIEHILLGFDHLAFLLALLVAGISLRRAAATITAFTVAHSLTLLAGAVGWVCLPSILVEATIAASIVVVAAANLWQRGRGAHRWPLAFGFGLVHGFGFAGVLADLQIGGPDMIWPLLTFNLGVEIGQLLFALLTVPLLVLATRRRGGRFVPGLVSVAVGIAGSCWLWERLAA